MKLYQFLIIIVIFCSCKGKNEHPLNIFPSFYGRIGYNQIIALKNDRVKLNDSQLSKLINIPNQRFEKFTGLGRFFINEMDSSKLRPFELILIEHKVNNETVQLFYTLDKDSFQVIDSFQFRPKIMELNSMYSHSSKLDHDGIAINFIEYKNDSDSIFNHSLELHETGIFEYRSRNLAIAKMFNGKSADNLLCGNYQYSDKDFSISLDLKDGSSSDKYSYRLEIVLPNNCIVVYENLDEKLIEDVINISEDAKLLIENKGNYLEIRSEKPICEDKNLINFILEKNS